MKIQPINFAYSSNFPISTNKRQKASKVDEPRDTVSFGGYKEQFIKINNTPIRNVTDLNNSFISLWTAAAKEGKIGRALLYEKLSSDIKLLSKLSYVSVDYAIFDKDNPVKTILSKDDIPIVQSYYGSVLFILPETGEEIAFWDPDDSSGIHVVKSREIVEFYGDKSIKKRTTFEPNKKIEEYFREDGTRYVPGFFDLLKELF